MAYFSLHAYDADVWLQEFRGLNQTDDGMNQDIRYAAEEKNLETINGTLQPRAAIEVMPEAFDDRIETLTWFYRRWYEGDGSKGWMVAASGGKLYYKQTHERTDWLQIEMPEGVTSFQSNVWSWVTYEINPVGANETIDVLVMSNDKDGMIMVIPPDRPFAWSSVKTQDWGYYGEDAQTKTTWERLMTNKWTIEPIEIPDGKKFGVIARSNERVWGGAIPGNPDMLMYSAPYDPTDWEENAEIPEDGAGDVLQPSWDGDSFTALIPFGDQLLAFKQHRVWRIQGTNPGEYVFSEQYGGGTPYPATIATAIDRVFLTNDDGLEIYDGMSVSPYMRDFIRRLWLTTTKSALHQMCAVMHDRKYYLALPVNGSEVNNALIILDLEEGTFLYHDSIYIESLLSTPDGLLATSSSEPGHVLVIGHDSWVMGKSDGAATKWITPWMDFGYKRIVKGGFDLYISPQVQDEAVTLTFSIQTEKKTKTKQYTIQPLTEQAIAVGKEQKYKRLHFGGSGRMFRLIIESEENVTAPWRLVGGLHLVVETDPD